MIMKKRKRNAERPGGRMCGEEFKEDGVALKERDLEIRPGPQSGSLGVEMGEW
jgi:hypothetical protein